MTDTLPPLRIKDDGERYYVVDELVLGLIEAHSGRKFGDPCIAGTGVPVRVGWLREYLERPDMDSSPYTREQIISVVAFTAGQDWESSRKRRKRMEYAFTFHWESIKDRQKVDYQQVYEVV